jgi:hypothetical protein
MPFSRRSPHSISRPKRADAGFGDWIAAHTRAFAIIGGMPRLLVLDNTKVAVIKACLYEPQVNRSDAEMAAHHDTAILPARPRRPRDKAKVEAAMLIIERRLLGRLRHRRFYSLAELNTAIGELLRQLNDECPDPPPCRYPRLTRGTRPAPPQAVGRRAKFGLPNGARGVSASITMSRSTLTFTVSRTVLPATRSRCGDRRGLRHGGNYRPHIGQRLRFSSQ